MKKIIIMFVMLLTFSFILSCYDNEIPYDQYNFDPTYIFDKIYLRNELIVSIIDAKTSDVFLDAYSEKEYLAKSDGIFNYIFSIRI